MSDHILYKSSCLTDAAAELDRLMDALGDVAVGLAQVDTSAEWWSKIGGLTQSGRSDARTAMNRLRTVTGKVQDDVSETTRGVRKAQTLFEEAERMVAAGAMGLESGSGNDYGENSSGSSGGGSSGGGSSGGGGSSRSWSGGQAGGSEKTDPADRAWFGYEFSDDHPGVTAWVGKASADIPIDNGSAKVEGFVGKAKAEAKTEAALMKWKKEKKKNADGTWEEEEKLQYIAMEAGGAASISLLNGTINGSRGDDYLGTEISIEADVGKASIEGKGEFSIGEDGINAKGKIEAMVAAVKGKASATINILGFEITAGVGGYAGALGAEAEFGIQNGKVKTEFGLAAAVGISASVEIGFNPTGWANFVDFVTFWK